MKKKITKQEARQLLQRAGVNLSWDYHQLTSLAVDKVLAVAKLYGYKKSPSAPGSKARMFYQFLQRG
jgi:hypothetical protein